MQRYDNTTVRNDQDGKQYYQTLILPEIDISTDDDYVVVTQQKRLDHLAQEYYNDPTLWWVIALANNISKPSLIVDSGTQLRIPKNPNSYIQNSRDING